MPAAALRLVNDLVGDASRATLSQVGSYLGTILAAHRSRQAADRRDLAVLAREAESCPPVRPFAAALRREPGMAVIAEVKRRSPSKGALALDLVPSLLAKAYATAGASGLSVLTDAEFFGGSPADLAEARAAVDLPVLRKDFTMGPADVFDARIMGADAVLLIVSALPAADLAELVQLAQALGLDALVEVHDEAEADTAMAAGARLIGVNQRDLRTFEVDRARAARVAAMLPAGVVKVAESGIRDHEDVVRLTAAGFDAILVGEALVTAEDPGVALGALLGGAA